MEKSGEYHLNRKELDLVVDAFTKALQEAEAQCSPEQIVDNLKDLVRAFL
ncbi:MAG: hypothetical protein LLG04_09405 [Parachlamydia sp.]|nr:hypothetical protein [Parachlamydia sp.]